MTDVEHKRVLLVDDHTAFAKALELVLGRTEDISVVALAHTLAEAREAIRNGGPLDLVVVDLMLPDGDGAELVGEIKERNPGTRVALLSANDDIASVARKVGADDAIRKDTALPEIVSSLRRLSQR